MGKYLLIVAAATWELALMLTGLSTQTAVIDNVSENP